MEIKSIESEKHNLKWLYFLMSVRNSVLVRESSLNMPSMQLVVVMATACSTPRIDMHMCLKNFIQFKKN